jgi:hypothetical protein
MAKTKTIVFSPATVFLAFAFCLRVNVSEAASRAFYDGFEIGNTNLWQQYDLRPKCLAKNNSTDSRPPHAGTFQAECNWSGADYTTMKGVFDVANETFIRAWVRYEADVDIDPSDHWGGKMGRLTTQIYADGDQYYWALSTDSLVWTSVIANDAVIGARWRAANFYDHNWHQLEIYTRPGMGTDGLAKVWLDDTLIIDEAMASISGPSRVFNSFYMMSNWSGATGCCTHDDNNHTAWDDFEVFTNSSAGAPTTGSMADGTIQAVAPVFYDGFENAATSTLTKDAKRTN